MKEFSYVITDPIGIHARPAGLLVKEAKQFTSTLTLTVGGKSVDPRKLIQLMGLGVKGGDQLTLSADGPDEVEAIAALEAFFKANL